jgi:hypothetical protein
MTGVRLNIAELDINGHGIIILGCSEDVPFPSALDVF